MLGSFAYIAVNGIFWLVGVAIALAIVVPLLRWALRINEQVALQQDILLNLRRINANTEDKS